MLTLLVLKLVTGIVTTHPAELPPGAAFSAAAAHRLDAGWTIGEVDVLDDGTELHLELTLVDGARAERLTLRFDGEGDKPLAFASAPVPVPKQSRVYRNRDEIAMVLTGGEVHTLYADCGAFFLEGRGGGATVGPDDYYVVEKTATGAAAQRMLARMLAAALEDEMSLAAVVPVASGVDIVLFDGNEEVLHVDLDDAGQVSRVVRRWSPTYYQSWDTRYSLAPALAAALRASGTVKALTFEEGGVSAAPTLTLSLSDGDYVVDMMDFVLEDADDMEDFGCGC